MTPVLLPQIRCLLNGSSCTETMAVTTISAAGIATATESAAADTAHARGGHGKCDSRGGRAKKLCSFYAQGR